MLLKLRTLWLFFGMLSLVWSVQAQDPVFSQYYAAPLQLNPAFTGISEGGKVVLNYRNQWPRINQAYVTYAASFDQFFSYINSGFGLSVLSDNAGRGLYRTTDVSAYYSYRARFNQRFQMRLGIEAGYFQSRVDWDRLVFLDQLDPEYGAISPGGIPYPSEEVPPEQGTSISSLDISAGILFFNDRYYGGISLKHLNTPRLSFLDVNPEILAGLPMSISLHGGAELDVMSLGRGRRVFVAPGFQFINQGTQRQLNIGTIFRYDKVGTGVWYRHANTNPDALIFILEGRQEFFKVSYSYDFTLSSLSSSGGAHEISLIFNFDYGREESRYNDCFNLFR